MNSIQASKKLVFITSRFPFPIEKGDKLRAYYQLRDLSKHWDIYLIAISDVPVQDHWRAAVKPFCKEIHVFEISKWRSYLSVLFGFFGRRPLQCYYFKRWSHQRSINQLLQQIQPDHIFAQLIRSTEYVKNYHQCHKTLDYMDALSAGVQKRMELASSWTRWVYELEWRRLLTYENVIYEYFENHLIISKQDRDLIPHPKKNKILALPNGVGEMFLSDDFHATEKVYDFCFVGNLSYPPNIQAVKFIAEELIPLLQKRGLHPKVLISGADPTAEVLKYQGLLHVSGWVDDIRQSYASAKIFVAPMFIGTGLQNKLLEALAMGVPCITTPLAFRALHAPENLILVADNAATFADAIEQLLLQDLAEKRAASKQFVLENFDWKVINERLFKVLSHGFSR